MENYEIISDRITLYANVDTCQYSVRCTLGDMVQTWFMTQKPYVLFSNGIKSTFPASSSNNIFENGTQKGIVACYENFENSNIKVTTKVYIEKSTNNISFEIFITDDELDEIAVVSFPAPFDFGAEVGKGYTVLPRMQGTLFPAGEKIVIARGTVMGRDSVMPIYGQKRNDEAYLAIYDTPFDAKFEADGDKIVPLWRTSLGHFSYPRRMIYKFLPYGDYNTMAKAYRKYVKERGQLVTLKEKTIKNPEINRLIGCAIIHAGIATHISPDCNRYNKDDPSKNDYHTSFYTRAEQLKKLKENGLIKGYTHFDGWGNHGYDNLHPSPFPPHQGAGGIEGMAELSRTAQELGYIFGIHDQYRDYYFDCPDFSTDEAVQNSRGGNPEPAYIWQGGLHTFLCPKRAPEYVRRNYNEFEKLGIKIEASYLDVFSIVEMDECFNPAHPVTREQCAEYRKRCFDILIDKGIIPSSEETVDCIIPALALCHHSPYFTLELPRSTSEAVGIPVPLFNLVYHDCIIIPWIGLKGTKGGWGIPGGECGYTHAILNAGPVYCPIDADAEKITQVNEACALAEMLTHCEMIKHEFISDNLRKQRTTYSNGTIIEVDFDTDEYKIYHN